MLRKTYDVHVNIESPDDISSKVPDVSSDEEYLFTSIFDDLPPTEQELNRSAMPFNNTQCINAINLLIHQIRIPNFFTYHWQHTINMFTYHWQHTINMFTYHWQHTINIFTWDWDWTASDTVMILPLCPKLS